jgi:hypothetical protein
MTAEQKIDILVMITAAKEKGICISRTCALLRIEYRRVGRWLFKQKRKESLRNLEPGPKVPLHKLLPEECKTVLDMKLVKLGTGLTMLTNPIQACLSFLKPLII